MAKGFRESSQFKTSIYILAVCAASLCTSESISNCSLSVDVNNVHVDCSNRNLTSIPLHLPENTTYLDLSHNAISTIDKQAFNLTKLKFLDVSFNVISSIQTGAFLGISSLQVLYLNNNKLELNSFSYSRDVFLPLKMLLKLHMQDNDHSDTGFYPEDVIGKLTSLEELKIDTFRKTTFGQGFSLMHNLKALLLGFENCKMSLISNSTFLSFENTSVTTLDLQYCPLAGIQKNAFWYFHSLEHLVLSNAIPLSPIVAVSAMYGLRGKSMKSIKVNDIFQLFSMRIGLMKERILSNGVLKSLRDVCVERFEMINVKLTWFDEKIFSKRTKFALCIKELDLSHNDLYGDPKILMELSFLPRLQAFNVSKTYGVLQTQNARKDICQPTSLRFGVSLPTTLKYLNIRAIGNNFGCIYDVVFYNAINLKYADFSYLGIEGFRNNITGLETLTYLDISGNNFVGMNSLFLSSVPKLETLMMSNVRIAKDFLLSTSSHILMPLKHLTTIDLSFNNLKILNPKLFSSNPIRKLDLSNNRCERMPFDLNTTPLLHDLDLSFNSITVFSDTEMKLLDVLALRNNLSLNLEGNLLSCGCHNLDFIHWLHTTDVKLNYGVDNICLADNGSLVNMIYMYENIDEAWQQCYGPLWLSVSISTFAFILLIMSAFYVVHRKKTWLLNVTLRLFGIKNVSQMLTRDDFLNDAYIGYSDADYQYICHTARDHLENRHGLKLFIKDRDTDPGRAIAHEIIRGIDSSWRCILFLTKTFLEDNWCDFTVEYLVYVASKRPSIRVILILCDDVMRGDISPFLLNVVGEQRIYRFGTVLGGEERLWRHISECIKLKSDCHS